MNERIKELWENCDKINTRYPEQGSPIYASAELLESFAELLIQECMTICDTEKADYAKSRKGAFDFEEKNIYAEGESACDTIKYKMKHRFGV